jgi:hypothetical protein
MAKQTFTTGQVLTAAQMTSLQQTAMGGGSTTAKTASYVLVAADAGTVVQMNSASATTITVNTALFAAGDTVQIQNVGSGVCTVTAGTATVSTSAVLALKQYDAGSLYFNSTSAALFFAADAADNTSPLTTKGDIYTFSTTNDRLPVGTNGQTLVADSTAATGLKWATASSSASYSGCRLNKVSGNQAIADSTYVAVTWPTEVFDVGGYHDTSTNTSRITIPSGKAGYYRFSWSQGVTAAASTCTLYTNGTGGTRNAFINVPNAEANQATIILSLAVGDYVEVYLRQTSGTSKIAFDENNGAAGFVWFDCEYLGA